MSHPEFGFSVTYRKDGDAPILFARGIDRSDPPKVKFWAQAWKAAHHKMAGLAYSGGQVRFGSLADIAKRMQHVCFTLKSGHAHHRQVFAHVLITERVGK